MKKEIKQKDIVKTLPLKKDLPDWVQEQVDLYHQDQNQKNQGYLDIDATLPYAEDDTPTFPIIKFNTFILGLKLDFSVQQLKCKQTH